MATSVDTAQAPIFARATLKNSIWYGSGLMSFLATAEMTGGHYALLHARMQKGFAPPAPHRHGPEDFYIVRGQMRFWVADKEIVATDGDFVRTVPGVWHTLQIESDEAEILLIFAPAGMEGFFRELGRPAEAMELPAGRVGPPDPERIRAVAPKYGLEFAPLGTTPQEMDTLPA
ncbi:MAG: cupin domain-containing protein [Thermomicrobia bacterium]|nr:cupin domain-containing protein [Thermomicrobia bacterium]